jgi:hypothetical protein
MVFSIGTLPDELGSPLADPLAQLVDLVDASILARIYEVLGHVDRRLTDINDRLSGSDLHNLLFVTDYVLSGEFALDTVDWGKILGGGADGTSAFLIAQLGLRSELKTALGSDSRDFERATKLCRRALIASLLSVWAHRLHQLTADDVFDLLNRRTVVLDGISAEALAPEAQVKLIREAHVSDLQVVRREWAGYLPSEIANIRNVMKGEGFEQSDKTTRESETTTQNLSETRTITEREEQSKVESELTQEVDSQLAIAINGHAEASAEFKYPVVTARISGGVDAGLSLQRSERNASKIAREAVSRALSRVDSMTQERLS